MQKDSRFFEDLSQFASGAMGSFMDMKREMETMIASQVESWLGKMNLVNREEFEVVKSMLEKARMENEQLSARMEQLEKTLAANASNKK